MTAYKLVPVEPTPEMVEAAESAHMPFGDMELAIRMAILEAPVVEQEPVYWEYRIHAAGEWTDWMLLKDERAGKSQRLELMDMLGAHGMKCEIRPLYLHPQPPPDAAQLVEALESAYHLIDNHSGETLPISYASNQMGMIDDALAAYRNGGEE